MFMFCIRTNYGFMISPKMYQNEAGDSYKNDAYIKRCI